MRSILVCGKSGPTLACGVMLPGPDAPTVITGNYEWIGRFIAREDLSVWDMESGFELCSHDVGRLDCTKHCPPPEPPSVPEPPAAPEKKKGK